MSDTEEDYAYDEWMSELYEEHKEQAIAEFQAGRLESYYVANPQLASASSAALHEAKRLLDTSPSAALVFAVCALEVGIREALLRPLVFGLVHQDSLARIVADLSLGHKALDRFRDLLLEIMSHHAGVDMRTFRRIGSSTDYWGEIVEAQRLRNRILHRATLADWEEAQHAMAVASAFFDDVLPKLLESLGFHLHDGYRICNKWECKRASSP